MFLNPEIIVRRKLRYSFSLTASFTLKTKLIIMFEVKFYYIPVISKAQFQFPPFPGLQT